MPFTYLLEKLDAAKISSDPFPHVHVENFLNDRDFEAVVGAPEISLRPATTIDDLFSVLDGADYEPIEFPGCTKSRADYVAWLQNNVKPKGTHDACEGKGMALRCTSPRSDVVRSLNEFFQSPELRELLANKFGITQPTQLDCGLQKYLNGYEISPHPDIRQKALTWMLNVNPGSNTEELDYHTHYMTFRSEWDFVRQFWQDTPDAETCWVPWQWCETRKRQRANNSIVVFAPRHDTLHAIRAHYDHLAAQRTQFYGNLWYKPRSLSFRPQFQDFQHGSAPKPSRNNLVKSTALRLRGQLVGWTPSR